MRLAIASNSVDTINGIKSAFSRFFKIKEDEITIIHQSTDSEVSEQPFEEAVYEGAQHRVINLMNKVEADFYASCEAGIEGPIGLYFNVQVVCIYNKRNPQFIFGKSAGWMVPSRDIEEIKQTDLDTYLRKKGITCLEDILGEEYSRSDAVMQATSHALSAANL